MWIDWICCVVCDCGRQMDEWVVRNVQMDGFMIHLQQEVRDAVAKEEQNLHVYSMLDVYGCEW